MTNRYVRSTDGSDASDGLTWANAEATLTGAAAADVAGDVIWVSQDHAESTAAAITFHWSGTLAAPTRIVCGNDAAEPPTALATTATVTTTGNSTITCSSGNDCLYVYGVTFSAGSGATGTASIVLNAGTLPQIYESCNFDLASTGTGSVFQPSTSALASTCLKNCGFQFSETTTQKINVVDGRLKIEGGSILSDAAITTLFSASNSGVVILVDGCDLSNGAAAMNVISDAQQNFIVKLRNCKMPASWSGSINPATPGAGSISELHNSDSTDTNYRLERKTQFGTVTHETTIVGGAGATDGTTAISWKMVSNANAEWNHQTLDSPEIVRWNETTGSAITATIEIVHDSVTNITDQQIWMEVQYLGTSGTPLSLFVDDAAADYITAAADQADSTASWTTTGLTNPNTQKLNVTFTPQEKGFIHAVVKLAQASKTVYVDPKITIS